MWVNDKAIKETKPKQVGVAHHENGKPLPSWGGTNKVYGQHGKSPTVMAAAGMGGIYWRKLTPVECERLQTVPDNYTNHVSNTQRYKMLGNGWTIEVITHILKNMEL